MDADTAMPLACVMDAIPAEERAGHVALATELFGAAQERREVEGGYAFRFGPEWLEHVTGFVRNERRCCEFLEFGITVAPARGPVWLRLTGPEGTQEFLRAELRL